MAIRQRCHQKGGEGGCQKHGSQKPISKIITFTTSNFADGSRDCNLENQSEDDKTDANNALHQVLSEVVHQGIRRRSDNAARRGDGSTANPMSTMVKPPRLSGLAWYQVSRRGPTAWIISGRDLPAMAA